jgi:hypothetical protein
MSTRHRVGYLIVLCPLSFVLCSAGCGLADYVGQMSSEADRVHAWDEETALLGSPIKLPELPKKDDKDQSWNVFLRLPRGVTESPRTAEGSTQAKLFGSLAQYEGSNASGIVNVYLGVSDQKDFVNSTFNYFGVSAGGDFITVPRSVTAMSAAGPALTPTISVKQRAAEGPQQYNYSFNFYEHGGTQVAVVFQLDKTTGAKANPAIKASLATLGVDDEVRSLRKAYSKPRRPARK